jgi:hypothetical protein
MMRTVNHAVGRAPFADFLLSKSIPRQTSNSKRRDKDGDRLLLAIAGAWLFSFFVVTMWVWHVTFG